MYLALFCLKVRNYLEMNFKNWLLISHKNRFNPVFVRQLKAHSFIDTVVLNDHFSARFTLKFYFILQISFWVHCFPELYFTRAKRVRINGLIQYYYNKEPTHFSHREHNKHRVSFELGKEIEKDAFCLVTSVEQRKILGTRKEFNLRALDSML